MPPRDWRLRVEDILEALDRIEQYTRGMTFESFSTNPMVVDAVVRNLTVIGEAVRHIPSYVQKLYSHIPWMEMQAMRNVLAHEYFGVSLSILWETVTKDLPPLRPLFSEMIKSGPDVDS